MHIDPVSPVIGAEVSGVDLAAPLSPEAFQAIHDGLMKHLVLFFRDQELSFEQHKALGRQFGDLHIHPAAPKDSAHPEIPADGNISFDAAGNPVSVNNAFFTSCQPIACNDWNVLLGGGPDSNLDGCVDALTCNTSTNQCESALGACPDGSGDVAAYTSNTSDAGGTAWLTTSAPVIPGEEITLEFHIWDTGDAVFDSLALLDNFRWKIEPTEVSTKN